MPILRPRASPVRRRLEIGQRDVGAGAVVRVVARHLLQQQRAVLDRPGQRPGLIERARERDDAKARAAAVGRLHADDAAERSRLADRAAGIGAGGAQAQFRRDRRGRAAGAAARDQRRRGARFSPRINRRSEVAGNVGRAHRKLVQVGLAEQDRARPPQVGRDGRFVRRHEAFQDPRARGRPDAAGAEQILDRERDALERPGLAAGQAPVGLGRHLERPLRGLGDERVQAARGLDRPDMRQRQFARRELFGPQARPRRGEREPRQRAHSTTFGTTK